LQWSQLSPGAQQWDRVEAVSILPGGQLIAGYFAEASEQNVITKLDQEGTKLSAFSIPGSAGEAEIRQLFIAPGSEDRLNILSLPSLGPRVSAWTGEEALLWEHDLPSPNTMFAVGLGLHTDGRIYVQTRDTTTDMLYTYVMNSEGSIEASFAGIPGADTDSYLGLNMALTPNGDILIVGWDTDYQDFVRRVSPEGMLLWAHDLDVDQGHAYSVSATSSGDLYAVQDQVLSKFSPDGALLWESSLSGDGLQVATTKEQAIVSIRKDGIGELLQFSSDGELLHSVGLGGEFTIIPVLTADDNCTVAIGAASGHIAYLSE